MSKLFFSNIPDLNELVGYRATHFPEHEIIGIQPPCCRELIFTVVEVLVSPAFDSKSNLLIVVDKSYGTSQDFLSKLNKLRIKLCSKLEVDPELFQYCFTYTVYQKLAPFWNKTASFLVKGRNFLQDCDKIPAVALELTVTDKICLALETFLVKMPPVQLEDFSVDFESLWNFKRNPAYSIQGYTLEDCSCYVLPSLKRGRIDSITHAIPSRAPFKNYEHIRQHWKVTYGYRLPSDDCQLFFNVSFGGSTAFTYPEWCIRSFEPTRHYRCNQDEICSSFLQDLQTRMPNICNTPLRFTKESLQWQKSLPSADSGRKMFLTKHSSQQLEKLNHFVEKNAQQCINPRSKAFQYVKDTNNNPSLKTPTRQYTTSKPVQFKSKIPNHTKKEPVNRNTQDNKSNKLISKKESSSSNNLYVVSQMNSLKADQVNSLKAKSKHGGNIIDIPDSPSIDQLVPNDLLLCDDFTGDQLEEVTRSHANTTVKETKRAGSTLVDSDKVQIVPIQNTTVNDLSDEIHVTKENNVDDIFECSTAESSVINQKVPTVTPNETKDYVAVTQSENKIPFEQKSLKTGKQRDINRTLLYTTQSAPPDSTTNEDTSRLVPSYNVSSKLKNDPIVSSRQPTSGKIVPTFGKKKKAKNHLPSNIKPSVTTPQSQPLGSWKPKPTFKTKNISTTKSFETNKSAINKVTTSQSNEIQKKPIKRPTTTTTATPNLPSFEDDIDFESTPCKKIKPSPKIKTTTKHRKPQTPNIQNKSYLKSPKGLTTPTKVNKSKDFCPQVTPQIESSQAMDLAMQILSQASNAGELSQALNDGKLDAILQPSQERTNDQIILSTPKLPLMPDSTFATPKVPVVKGNIRASQPSPDSTVVKKQRSKPKIQENIDVEVMARNKQLNKVNAITLRSWLKSKGVSCKSNEKKDELVKKVQVYLNIYLEELAKDVNEFIENRNKQPAEA